MERVKNPFLRFGIYVILIGWILYSIIPFGWTVLTSIKRPIDANVLSPRSSDSR